MLCQYGCGREAIKQFKNGKFCCSERTTSCPEFIKRMALTCKNSERYKNKNPAFVKINCSFCNKEYRLTSINKHESSCYLNSKNLRLCPLCNKPVKDYNHTVTCSNKCAKTYFVNSYNNARNNRKDLSYRYICFTYHKKECIVCGEKNIVSVHHYDNNKYNNEPSNLLPLCPTHHHYIHSKKFARLIYGKATLYIKEWKENHTPP